MTNNNMQNVIQSILTEKGITESDYENQGSLEVAISGKDISIYFQRRLQSRNGVCLEYGIDLSSGFHRFPIAPGALHFTAQAPTGVTNIDSFFNESGEYFISLLDEATMFELIKLKAWKGKIVSKTTQFPDEKEYHNFDDIKVGIDAQEGFSRIIEYYFANCCRDS